MQSLSQEPKLLARAMGLMSHQAGASAAQTIFETVPTFNAASQYTDVGPGSGHEWQAPRAGDLRGPCPGLNAFANHGFLPRNGYATIAQCINATTYVVGIGPELATFLGIYGAIIAGGDGQGWTIGGTPPLGVDSLAAQKSGHLGESITQKPYFFNGPFIDLVFQSATYTFIYRFTANHSAKFPYGKLTYETAQSCFAIPGTPGNYKVHFGYESIPANWYKRANTAPYTIPYFLTDTATAAGLHSEFLSVDGNLDGKPNKFAGVDVYNLTGGLYNSKDLLKGNNLGCFAYQIAAQFKSDIILGNLRTQLEQVVGSVVKQLDCPQLETFDAQYLQQFPSYQKTPAYGK